MKASKILYRIATIVVTLVLVNLFAWVIYYANADGSLLGPLKKPIKKFSRIPNVAIETVKEVISPERLLEVQDDFTPINKLSYNVFVIKSHFENGKWIVNLENLKTDTVLHSWYLSERNFKKTGKEFSHCGPYVPILMPDTSLIIINDESNNLYRINKSSEIVWKNEDYDFHHAYNLDAEGNVWVPGRELINLKQEDVIYWENSLVQFDTQTGKVLQDVSITDILVQNGLISELHGKGNGQREGIDPLHLNDVQPALTSTPYWNQGDLFISIRNRSLILVYRPSTGAIIHKITGPFIYQHDIDFGSGSTISVFNNNITSLSQSYKRKADSDTKISFPRLNKTAGVQVYNFSDSTFTDIYPSQFDKNNIFTKTQGLHHFLSNGDLLIESYDQGKIFIFNEDELIYEDYSNDPINGNVEYPHWVRVYEDLDILSH